MTELRKYQEQFERMKRCYSQFQTIDLGIRHDRNTDYYQDIVYAFFINCYHLKDWIISDKTVKLKNKEREVENFIYDNKCMNTCENICNGIKHLNLKKSKLKGRKHELKIGDSKGTIYSAKYNIVSLGVNKDAFELASECVKKWEEFIKKNIN